MISCEIADLSSDILRYDIVMLSKRGDWKPPGRWTAHRSGAVHPTAKTTPGNSALPATEHCAAAAPAVAARVSPFDSAQRRCWRQVPLHTRAAGRARTCYASRATPRFLGHRYGVASYPPIPAPDPHKAGGSVTQDTMDRDHEEDNCLFDEHAVR
jgi:hypothetical protein